MKFRFKTKTTLYLDLYENEWTDDCPNVWSTQSWMKSKKDYETLRKGSVLEMHTYNGWYGENESENKDKVILIGKSGTIIIFDSMKDLLVSGWFQLL